jgi:hyperosmotically inducible periplasmic protein
MFKCNKFVSIFAAVLVCLLSLPGLGAAQDAQPPAPDNTNVNKDQSKPTADQQKVNPADRSITQQIRKAIHQDTTLSTYAHNVKIISQDGKVTLRGPVRSEDEKSNIEAKAVAVAGHGNVTNELEVAPKK